MSEHEQDHGRDTPRKYSIAEIDAMRTAIYTRVSYQGMRSSYLESERKAQIEDELRTHMLNGTRPEELQKAAYEARESFQKDEERRQEYYRKLAADHAVQFPARARPDGVLECLPVEDKRAKPFDRGGYRCTNCRDMQPADSFITWVPDNVRVGERAESIVNAVNANRWNGSHSGWCLDCARKLTRKAGSLLSLLSPKE